MAYSEHKVDQKLIHGPVEELCGNPNAHEEAEGVFDGEPGYPKRTTGGTQLPEKTLDEAGEFGKEPSEG